MGTRRRIERQGRRERGSQLLEFALVLPILLFLAMGAWDFGSKIVQRQKLTNAAREGARVMVSNTLENTSSCKSSTMPCTVIAAATDVQTYLNDAGMDASWITPDSPNSSGATNCDWTYQQSGTTGASLEINGAYAVTYTQGSGATATTITVPATQVTLIWPTTWQLRYLLGGTDFAPSKIQTSFTMANLADICGN